MDRSYISSAPLGPTCEGVRLTHDLAVRCDRGFDCAQAGYVAFECLHGWDNDYNFAACDPSVECRFYTPPGPCIDPYLCALGER